jgi:hypothetical protein
MTGETFINNKDIWTYYSAKLIESSFDNLLLPPPNKEFVSNSSRLTPGKQILVGSIVKDERSVSVIFAITCASKADYLTKYNALIAELSTGMIALKVVPNGLIYNLVVESYAELKSGTGLRSGKLTVRFNEPDPTNRIAL